MVCVAQWTIMPEQAEWYGCEKIWKLTRLR
ncbi:hypothetical protein BN873_330087 [Candidatus Competibacter denitrificans Run_A_D11]|uniref:Uncharacterized protein n=1 Tax=Candidatus Competibacter denitrificans Run_A_D11 TaxID=1400863 RepID=W6M9Z6_9GAMM|nr:hypothetical protein BN873_330087 [Candidatus Competibacter denitrificans Run_A_D11]